MESVSWGAVVLTALMVGAPAEPAPPNAEDGQTVLSQREPYDPQWADRTVAFWEMRAKSDPEGAIARRELAGAYLARQRETGDIADAVRAEAAARESLKLLTRHNTGARLKLARALLAQHRFPEVLTEVEAAHAVDPDAAGRLRVDVLIEMGRLDEAEAVLARCRTSQKESGPEDDPNLLALQAHLESARGKSSEALKCWREARKLAEADSSLGHEVLAWYRTMVGHTLIDSGQLDEGERAFREALEIFPRDYRALTGLAEVAAARGRWDEVVTTCRAARKLCEQNPEILALEYRALKALGRDDEARDVVRRFETLEHSFPRIYDRHWAIFCADIGTHLPEAERLARQDLELRQDAEAFDTLAWVLARAGRGEEARAVLARGQARGPCPHEDRILNTKRP